MSGSQRSPTRITDADECVKKRARRENLQREVGQFGCLFSATRLSKARDKLHLLQGMNFLHKEWFETELGVPFLYGVIIGAEGINHVGPMDQDKLTLFFLQLREFVLVGFEFSFQRHITTNPQVRGF
jgi:hypothetical protein